MLEDIIELAVDDALDSVFEMSFAEIDQQTPALARLGGAAKVVVSRGPV